LKKHKRIGMILDSTFPPDPRVENEAVSLIKAGHDVFLFCLHYGNQSFEQNINEIQVKRYLSNRLEYKLSALVYTLPFYTSFMAKKITHFIKYNHIQVLHVHDIQVAGAVFKANKSFGLPILLDLHENRPEIMKFYGHLQKIPGKWLIKPKKWKQKEEQFCEKATKVIVVTQEAKEELLLRIKIKAKNVLVVPNTVRRSFYKDVSLDSSILNKYKSNYVLLYIGDTALRRGLQTAIMALVKLKFTIPHVKLVIVGKSKTDGVLKQQVKDLKLDDYVSFEGWQNPSLFPSYITSSDICISPLHRNLHHDTTYANKLFQYMSFAKPMLVSNATAQQNLVTQVNCGLIHKEKNEVDFTSQVLSLYQQKNKSFVLANNGKSFVANEFNWEITSQELISAYQQI